MNTEYAFENGPELVPEESRTGLHQDSEMPKTDISANLAEIPTDQTPSSEEDNAKPEERLQPRLIEESVVDPPQTHPPSESDVFDKLSKTLEGHASKLKGNEKQLEKSLRPKVAKALAKYTTGNSDSGRLLVEYRTVFKSKRKWTEVAKELGRVINRSDRTIFRMIDEYEASLESPEPEVEFDRAGIVGPEVKGPERLKRNARLAIRVFLNNFPATEREKKLADLLAEEAYQVWGKREPFSIEIEIVPRESSLTIDGRKRPSLAKVQEKAA